MYLYLQSTGGANMEDLVVNFMHSKLWQEISVDNRRHVCLGANATLI